ncbi:hypothetical protein FBD94_09820 [Pedobacter hiemivivus]|uniref:Uncharacterized protein n=1 Tax=Pedobacter hiemivivus TaxID=2530454 RepID=A0A4U1GEI1_9SPHI|nr:DUF6266 family protein [Pedobacter hiemivivus]TKC62501.1 hypothetical protein FBD94_09820 [Pedobacter hiemivivus]
MAKLKYGIFGPISGKIGPIVGATWMGVPYIRKAPEIKAIPDPRSTKQIANEQKMKFTNILLAPFHHYMSIGFQNLAIRKTAISAAYSVNFHQAITGVHPDLGVDYSKMVMSVGVLPGIMDPVITLIAPDTIELTWQKNTNPKASHDDQLMLVLYCPELKIADGFSGGKQRALMHCRFQFNPHLKGKILEVYLGVTSFNRKKIANSIYLGRIEP